MGNKKRDGMKLWEFAFEEKNFLLFDSVRVSRGLGGWPPPGRIHYTALVYKETLLGISILIDGVEESFHDDSRYVTVGQGK